MPRKPSAQRLMIQRQVLQCLWDGLTIKQIAGRLHQTATGLDGVMALVVQCSPDFGAGRVQVVVLVYPTSSAVFP